MSAASPDFNALVLEALAEVRATTLEELTEEIAATEGGVDSKEAEVVISILETKLDQELAKVEDLEPEQLTSISTLVDLLQGSYTAPGSSAGH